MVLPSLFNSDDPCLDISTMPKQYQTINHDEPITSCYKTHVFFASKKCRNAKVHTQMYYFSFKSRIGFFWLGQELREGFKKKKVGNFP